MTSSAKFFLALPLVGCFALVGCKSEAPAPSPAAETSSTAETGPATQPEAGAPKIASPAPVHEFGAIKPTDTIEHVFTITNEGSADLHIERVQRT